MKISAMENTAFSIIGDVGLKKSNLSNNIMSPLQKQKLLLEEKIKKVEEGKNSKENKNKLIKELQKKLQEIEKQLTEEKDMKLGEKLEGKKEKENDTKDKEQKIKEEQCENPQVINKNIMIGITSAFSYQKVGKVAHSVYRAAKAKGDMSTAQRALKYTMSEIKKSLEGKRLIERGMKEYKKQIDNLKKAKAHIDQGSGDNNIVKNSVDDVEESKNNVEEQSLDTLEAVANGDSKAEISIKETSK
ncbi:TPA: hypothetical protein LA742_000815 [Clostridium botulinum]|uniref:hypothetical protein n=1 Tax=Clostridium TaxID=1485 RepID=UPI00077383A9|nr:MULTISPECIES: hypothetical protein [Clostridium]AUM94204.1 hypothetical protein RSJ11_03150 [Clostridium sporogenes]AVQ51629.1 hypothetical protein C7M59_01645 [Clostridium botulinum]HBJ2612396.1 hypothetical protein [Clostridium botulinum]